MNEMFEDFAKAHALHDGYLLAQTLSPVAPPNKSYRLQRIWLSTSSHNAKADIKQLIKSQKSQLRSVDHEELSAWVEVYLAYWNAVGEILAEQSGKVCSYHVESFHRTDSYI